MTHKKIFISAALLILLSSTGCNRSRWLSRKDYSEMHDPFMENETAVAETPAVPQVGDGSGRARLSDTNAASISMAQVPSSRSGAPAGQLSGPKPIQQASGSALGRPAISQASYPQDVAGPTGGTPRSSMATQKGPSLSDFMSQPGSTSGATTNPGTIATTGNPATPGNLLHRRKLRSRQNGRRQLYELGSCTGTICCRPA